MAAAKAGSLAGQSPAARDKTPRKMSIAGLFFINIQRLASYIIRHIGMFCRAAVVVQTQQPVNVSNAPEGAACQCFLLFGTMDPTSRFKPEKVPMADAEPFVSCQFYPLEERLHE